MCHRSVTAFFRAELTTPEIAGRRILEVGSRDVNGTVRPILISLGARDYVGVDLEPGPGVDRVCDVTHLASLFDEGSFEVVVSTEMLEHVRDWRSAVSNLKRVLAPGGLLVITTRSFGFPYHDYPGDFWRYELDDIRGLFGDFEILKLVADPGAPGVFLKARKPAGFREVDTSSMGLFSVVRAERSRGDVGTEEEIQACRERMGPLTELGLEIARVLVAVDLTDVGQRDFRNLWQTAERVSDQIERIAPGAESLQRSSRRLERVRRQMLEFVTAARLARGRSFGQARKALLASAAGATGVNILRIPWASVEQGQFRQILDAFESMRALCLKIQAYARPATGS